MLPFSSSMGTEEEAEEEETGGEEEEEEDDDDHEAGAAEEEDSGARWRIYTQLLPETEDSQALGPSQPLPDSTAPHSAPGCGGRDGAGGGGRRYAGAGRERRAATVVDV